jgi:hypothetical protein
LPAMFLGQSLGVYADSNRLEAEGIELVIKFRGVTAPQRVASFEADMAEESVAERTQVLQVDVPEDDDFNAVPLESFECVEHGTSVHIVGRKGRARSRMRHWTGWIFAVGNDYEIDRETERVSLFLHELPSDPVHGDAVIGLAETGDEFDDADAGMALVGVIQRQGTIFAAAPEEDSFLACVHR